MGWVLGNIRGANRDRRYHMNGNVANFVIKFDQDEDAVTTRVHLTQDTYDANGAEDAWVLFVPI